MRTIFLAMLLTSIVHAHFDVHAMRVEFIDCFNDEDFGRVESFSAARIAIFGSIPSGAKYAELCQNFSGQMRCIAQATRTSLKRRFAGGKEVYNRLNQLTDEELQRLYDPSGLMRVFLREGLQPETLRSNVRALLSAVVEQKCHQLVHVILPMYFPHNCMTLTEVPVYINYVFERFVQEYKVVWKSMGESDDLTITFVVPPHHYFEEFIAPFCIDQSCGIPVSLDQARIHSTEKVLRALLKGNTATTFVTLNYDTHDCFDIYHEPDITIHPAFFNLPDGFDIARGKTFAGYQRVPTKKIIGCVLAEQLGFASHSSLQLTPIDTAE